MLLLFIDGFLAYAYGAPHEYPRALPLADFVDR